MRWGTSFDTLGEAYDLYKLYSWEKGSGIRYEMSKCGEDKVHARNLLWLCDGDVVLSGTCLCVHSDEYFLEIKEKK